MDICLESFNYTNNDVVNESKIGSIITKIKEALLALIGKIKAAFAKIREKLSKKSASEKSPAPSGEPGQRRERVHPYHEPKSSDQTSVTADKGDEAKSAEPVEEPKPKQVQLTAEEEKLLSLVPKIRTSASNGGLDLFSETARRKFVKIMNSTSDSEIIKRANEYIDEADIKLCAPIDKMEYYHDNYKRTCHSVAGIIKSVSMALSSGAGAGLKQHMMGAIIHSARDFDSSINNFEEAAAALKKFVEDDKWTTYKASEIKNSSLYKTIYDHDCHDVTKLKYNTGEPKTSYWRSLNTNDAMLGKCEKCLDECQVSIQSIKAKVEAADERSSESFKLLSNIATSALHILSRCYASTLDYMTFSAIFATGYQKAIADIYHEKEDSIKEESFNFCTIR